MSKKKNENLLCEIGRGGREKSGSCSRSRAASGSRFLWDAIEAAQKRKGDQAFDAGQRVNAMLCDHHVYECVRWDRVAEILREVGDILSENAEDTREVKQTPKQKE